MKCKKGYKIKDGRCVKTKNKAINTLSESKNYQIGGYGEISFTSLLTILFIGLKLGKVIDWSWWWVLSPLWISLGIGVVIFLIILIFGVWLKNE